MELQASGSSTSSSRGITTYTKPSLSLSGNTLTINCGTLYLKIGSATWLNMNQQTQLLETTVYYCGDAGPITPAFVDVINQCQLAQGINYTSTGLTFYGSIAYGSQYGYNKGDTHTWVDIVFLTGITANLTIQAASGYGTGYVYWDNVLLNSGSSFSCNFTKQSAGHLQIKVYNNNLSNGSCQLSGTIVPI